MANIFARELRRALAPAGNFSMWLQHREVCPPGWTWAWPHLRLICERLEKVTRGDTKRLMIFMPPRHGKSELLLRYAAWRLESDPTLPVIVASYGSLLAERLSRRCRRICEARKVPLREDAYSAADWETVGGGGVRAVGVGAGITGVGGKLIVIDDPVKSREEAESETFRERAFDWYTNDLLTRLEPGGATVLIMTRWHHDDLAGRLLAEQEAGGEQWDVLSLPALAEEGEDPLGRRPGEALCPERYDAAALAARRQAMGSRSFQALYQQHPTDLAGELLRPDRIAHARPELAGLRVFQAWDLAISQKASADYSVCATVAVGSDQTAFLLHLWRERASFNDVLAQMQVQAAAWHPSVIGIETAGYQAAAFQEATRRFLLPFREVKATSDKETRAQLLAARIDAGKFAADRTAPWWPAFEAEARSFPAGRHDDQVDAVVHALGLAVGGVSGRVSAGTWRGLTADVARQAGLAGGRITRGGLHW